MTRAIWIISQYSSTPVTGSLGRHYYMAKELERQGHHVRIIAASHTHHLREPPVVEKSFVQERREGVNMVWIKTSLYAGAHSKKRIWNWFVFAWKLSRLRRVLAERPDVVLYSSPSLVGYLGAERLARRMGAKLAFEVRDIWPLTLLDVGGYSANHPFVRFLQWIENRAYKNADIVLSNLPNAYDHMQAHGLDRKKFCWIPNGIWLDEVINPEPLPESIVEQLPKDKFLVGYAGTLGLANCLATLIGAAERLKAEQQIHFVLTGNGREKAPLQELVAQKQLDNVSFIDAIPKPQVQSMLDRFDALYIGLTQSALFRYGVSPNKLFDYLYAAKPVLYAIDSGNYHPVADAGAGLELPPEDAAALADAILKLHHMPASQRQEMGNNGRAAVLAQYEYGALAGKLADVLWHGRSRH